MDLNAVGDGAVDVGAGTVGDGCGVELTFGAVVGMIGGMSFASSP